MPKGSKGGKGSASYGRGVSSARLSQKSGTSFGGFTKVKSGTGSSATYRMRPTGR